MSKKTVLIVDDTYENLYLLRVILEEAGFNVIEASNGKEGLKMLYENSNVDLIISDILMPIMDGYLFCQACKKEKVFKNIPFIFYTSTYTEKLDEEFGLKLGASQFLRKPIDHDELLYLVNDMFDSVKTKVKYAKKVRISEGEVLKLYSERLINKLEQKSLDLGNEVIERKKAEQLLIHKNEILDLIAVNTPLNKIFDKLLLNYESIHPDYFGAIRLLDADGAHLSLESAPSMPKDYYSAVKKVPVSKEAGSCGAAAFTKKPVIVSDVSNDALCNQFKEISLKHNIKSCWSLPILSKNNTVLGTLAISSKTVRTPSLDEIQELNFAVSLANIAIEKYRTVEEIRRKDESYKLLFDQATDVIISFSLDGTIYSFNRASYVVLGYTEKEFSKFKIQDIILEDLVQDQENLKKLLEGEAIVFSRKFAHKNKSIIDLEISAKVQNDGKILGVARDVTERKKAELELKTAKEFTESLIDSMQDGLSVIDANKNHIHVNPALCRITGYSKEELLGIKPPFPYWPPEYLDEINDIVDKTLLGIDKSGESVFKRKNGERFPVYMSISRVKDNQGTDVAFFASIQDISEKVKAREALKAAKEFSDKLIRSMQEGLLIVDLEGKILMVNNSLSNILGYSEEELLGINLPYPFAKTEDLELMLAIKDEVATGETTSFQLEFYKKNGEKFLASFLSGNIKNDKGEVIALFGTVKDVSEEDKARKLLEDNAKKSADRKNVIMELASLVGTDYNEALKKITALSAETLNVERVNVLKFNNDKTELISEKLFIKKDKKFESGLVIRKQGNEAFFDYLMQNKTINAPDVFTSKYTKGFTEEYLIPLNIKSKLSVPIQGVNETYGVLCFEQIDTARIWSYEEEEFATSIANLVSLMIESHERKIAEKEAILANEQLILANKELNILRNRLEQENIYLRNEIDLVFNYEEMVYGSEAFSNVLTEIEKVAPTNATVLLTGESGTGKELLARAVHNTSLRNSKPLIKVNCSAIPRELIESELFGHKKGSFTGAYSDKIGKFELADGGTLFLDEIGELPLDMQPKILRFLQEGEIEVVGGTGMKKLDVRVIAATNRNLKEEIKKKQFREDLYFRLNVFPIAVPALRDRKDDIPLLVEHFVDKFNKAYSKNIKYISDEAMAQLIAYNWPGNIRELENLIERASILSANETLIIPGFESKVQKSKSSINSKNLSLDFVQRQHILRVLEQCNWKISGNNGAATLLGLKPSTLRDKMTKLDISKP
ncbi:sigma 54-interacting transcriptional regulator [Mariniflexile aquimaris]|uniref:Sigma 54-interacting transcriptional regulator n=1 Tax=Mariniflexile aquimaris TaxID=881009 RepID=A0ABW3BMP9_9FLAO